MHRIFYDVKGHLVVILTLGFTVIITKVKGDDQCSFQNLIDCTNRLSAFTDSGLTLFNSKSDLDKICPNLKDSVKCIHGFTRKCMTKEDRLHFRKLFYGTGLMIHDLCRPGRYQNEYLKYAPCMINASMENEICFETYSTTMERLKSNSIEIEHFHSDMDNILRRKRDTNNEGIKSICCAFQQYAECSTAAVKKKCGAETANFSIRFLTKMSSSMLNVHCMEYGKIGCSSMKFQSKSSGFKMPVLTILMWTTICQLIIIKIVTANSFFLK